MIDDLMKGESIVALWDGWEYLFYFFHLSIG